jgi:hypothetical protein
MKRQSYLLICLLVPFTSLAQWTNDGAGNNYATGNIVINGGFQSSANYGLTFAPAGDAIIRKNTAGNLMISSGAGTSDIRLNYSYGGGSGGVYIFDGGAERNAHFKVTPNGHLIITPSGYQGVLGNVGIGTSSTVDAKLTVAGNIRAREVRITIDAGSDFVFEKEYDLKTLAEVENFIRQHGHLPDVAPAKEMENNGLELGKMDMKLLQKIEELTLYMIEQNKKIEALQSRVVELESKK